METKTIISVIVQFVVAVNEVLMAFGDIVDYNGTLYKSLIDGNVYSPDKYPAGWEIYEEV